MSAQTSLAKRNGHNAIAQFDENIISSIVINGDLSKLSPQQKVEYYRQFCERLGLDPLSQPFKLLKLNGKETLYCDRSGTAQLNKVHKVSHDIRNRESFGGVYIVTAQASTPDGRHTESIGVVTIDNLKGDALCNAMMKAETKAKRRATLDLLGLGILDEIETETIPNAQTGPAPIPGNQNNNGNGHTGNPYKNNYQSTTDISNLVSKAVDVKELESLFYLNTDLINANPQLKQQFTVKKNELINTPATPPTIVVEAEVIHDHHTGSNSVDPNDEAF